MRAAVIDGYGGGERFALREVARPVPGAGQILVRVRATSVNPIDWKLRRGLLRWVLPGRFPWVLGFDVAGEVAARGPEAGRFEPGDRVYARLDDRRGGAYAEYAAVGEAATAAMPPGLSFEEAAAIPLAGLTALQALRDRGELAAGERVLVNGAAGGVGHFAVQIGAALGARVTGVASGRNQDLVRELGAERAIDREREDFVDLDETFAVVFDAVAGSGFRACQLLLAPRGVYVTTLPRHDAVAWAALTALGLGGEGRKARLVSVRSSGDDLDVLARLVAQGKLRPLIDRVFRLDEIAAAHAASEPGHTRGKIVVRIDP